MSVNPAYVPNLPAYNESMSNGGDPLEVDVNAPFVGFEFHYVFQVIMGCLVFLIVPGIGMLYGGMARRKSALAMIFQSLVVISVCTFQWMFWGFSLAFSRDGGPFIGTLSAFGLKNVVAAPSWGSPVIPDIVFCFYELMFCACATMIVVGGAFERGRILPSILFSFAWATIVYCPIAFWTWNANGWLYKLGALDFAGGGPVHISSGTAGLAYALVLGKRAKFGEKHFYKPHNVTVVFLGTVLIWFGWFGFNGGSAINASVRSMMAIFNTNAAACTGVLGWTIYSYFRHGRKFSVIGACSGAICGLVGVTPAAGYVQPWLAAVIGFITAIVVCATEGINELIHIDDGLEVFRIHGIGGMCGAFLTGLFATSKISALDGGLTIARGAIDHHGKQIAYQLAEIAAIASYSFTISLIMLLILKYIPGLHLRVDTEAEIHGSDIHQFHDELIGEWSLFQEQPEHAIMTNAQPGHATTPPGSSTEKLPEKMPEGSSMHL